MPGRIIRAAAVCALLTALGPLTSGRAIASGVDFFNFQPPSDPDATVERLVQPEPKWDLLAFPEGGLWAIPRAHTDLPDEPEHTDLPDEPEAKFKPIFLTPRSRIESASPFGSIDVPSPMWLTSPYQPLPPVPDSGDNPSPGGEAPGSSIPTPGAVVLLLGASAFGVGTRRRRGA